LAAVYSFWVSQGPTTRDQEAEGEETLRVAVQIPDFSVGYGSEIEEDLGWADPVLLVVVSLLVIAAWIWYRRRKGKKR